MSNPSRESNQTSASKRKDDDSRRSIARTAADIAIGGTALAADKAIETAGAVVDHAQDALTRGRREIDEATERAEHAVGDFRRDVGRRAEEGADTVRRVVDEASGSQHSDGRVYEDRTRAELYDLAAERDIAGRSTMRKAELIEALRAHQ